METMSYNPLDAEGYQKIDVGDRVKVIGEMDVNLFEGCENWKPIRSSRCTKAPDRG